MSDFFELVENARKAMGATKAIRLKAHAERSRKFNEQCARDFESQRVTQEQLKRVIDLGAKEL